MKVLSLEFFYKRRWRKMNKKGRQKRKVVKPEGVEEEKNG